MYQLNKQHRSPKTPNKKRARIQHDGSSCSYRHGGAVNNADLRNTLHSISTSKKFLSHCKANIKSPKAKVMSKLVSCIVPSLLVCTGQVAIPIICFQNIPFPPYSDTLHSPTDHGIMPDVQQGKRKQVEWEDRTPHTTFALRGMFITLQSLPHPDYSWICFNMLCLRLVQSHLLLLCPAHTTKFQMPPSANTVAFTD